MQGAPGYLSIMRQEKRLCPGDRMWLLTVWFAFVMNESVFSSEAGGIETVSNGEMKKAFGSWDTSASAWFACGTKECSA